MRRVILGTAINPYFQVVRLELISASCLYGKFLSSEYSRSHICYLYNNEKRQYEILDNHAGFDKIEVTYTNHNGSTIAQIDFLYNELIKKFFMYGELNKYYIRFKVYEKIDNKIYNARDYVLKVKNVSDKIILGGLARLLVIDLDIDNPIYKQDIDFKTMLLLHSDKDWVVDIEFYYNNLNIEDDNILRYHSESFYNRFLYLKSKKGGIEFKP